MTQSSNWEERLLTATIYNELEDYDETREATQWKLNYEKLKDFIRQERTLLLEEIKEEIEGLKLSSKTADDIDWTRTGYDDALQDTLKRAI